MLGIVFLFVACVSVALTVFLFLHVRKGTLKKVSPDVQARVETTVGKNRKEAVSILSSMKDWKYQIVSRNSIEQDPQIGIDRSVHFYLVLEKGIIQKVWWNDEAVDIEGTKLDTI